MDEGVSTQAALYAGMKKDHRPRTTTRTLTRTFLLISLALFLATRVMAIEVDTVADAVATDGMCSFREAINNANAGIDTTGGDCEVGNEITFASSTDGIPFVLTGAADEDDNASGDLDIFVDLEIRGNGRDLTILDGANLDRVLHVASSADVFVLEGVEIRNGEPPAVDSRGGGAFINADVEMQLRDCRFRDNRAAGDAGGLGHSNNTDVHIERCEFLGNQAGANGGAYGAFQGAATLLEIVDSLFEDNTAVDRGGAIFRSATGGNTRLIRTTLRGNRTSLVSISRGGGGLTASGSDCRIDIVDSIFEDNEALDALGGALLIDGNDAFATISGSLFANNRASSGGGIAMDGLILKVENSTLSGNEASEDGGGILQTDNDSETFLGNVTIVGNVSDADDNGTGDGGGINKDSGDLRMANSILATNIDLGGELPDCRGSIDSLGYNLVQALDNSCGSITFDETTLSGLDPMLGPLADNGGVTPSHEPLPGSPVIDAADPAGCRDLVGAFIVDDQRQVPRSLDGDDDGTPRCDIGAVERHRLLPIAGRYCETLPIEVPDLGFAVGTIAIPDSFTIDDVNVHLVVDHPRVGDLAVDVMKGGTFVTLLDRPNGGAGNCEGHHAGLVFSDEGPRDASASCSDVGLAYDPGGTYNIADPALPPNTLSAFDGQDAQGAWNLVVSDLSGGDVGQLLTWCLDFEDDIFVDGFETGDTSLWSETLP